MKFCSSCGIEIDDTSVVCPSCGEESRFSANSNLQHMSSQAQYRQLTRGNSINKYILTGFILGILSWVINLAGIVGILAIVFSALGLNRIGDGDKGKWFAVAGLISGTVNTIYALVMMCSLL